MGHDECHYQSYEFMMERKPTYWMQAKSWPLDQGFGGARKSYQGQK